jgi:hypothetical protein
LGDIPEEYSGEENDEAEEDFVPGDNWDIVELNMRPYEPISTSIPSELASLLLYKNSRLHTMLHTTSKLAIVVEMSGEPHYAHRSNSQQVEIFSFSLTKVELERWTPCKKKVPPDHPREQLHPVPSLSPPGPVRGGGRREG